jgi:hypothetical protein
MDRVLWRGIVTNEVGLGRFSAPSSSVDWWEHSDKSATKILKERGVDNV